MAAGSYHFQVYLTQEGGYAWRLVSPNGRALGQVATPLASLEDARASVSTTTGAIADLQPVIRTTPDSRWLWTLVGEAGPVARGASTQDRQVRCVLAVHRFVAAAALGRLDPAVLYRPGGFGESSRRERMAGRK